jgi:hypothetical protein
MRAPGMLRALPFALLCAACSFRVIPDPGAPDDGRIDGARGTPLRKLITIDPAKVTGGQVQFPVWILLDGDADLAAHATDDGSDIYFTLGDGTPAPFQIQRWTKTAGHLEAWVRADLNDVTSTVLELRYGDPSTARAPSPMSVFSSSFAAVWHLEDPLDTMAVADATGQHAGTATGLGPTDQVAAQLGGGVDFDGAGNQRINFTLPITGGGDHTISAWVNQRTAAGFDTIVTMGSPVNQQSRWLHSHYTTGLAAGFFGNDWNGTALPNIDNMGWQLIHWTFKGSNRQSHIYRNGMDVGSDTFNSGVSTQGPDGNLGYAPMQWGPGGTEAVALNGVLDEVRIATAERSAGWIATEYANQHDPQTFYAIGAEEPVS